VKGDRNQGDKTMFGTTGIFGSGMKAARTGDQIDAVVTGAKSVIANTKLTATQFDFIESQLQQFAQGLVQEAPHLAGTFNNLVQQINNIQGQIVNGLTQVEQALVQVDGLTDKIQG
jgi:ABC-type transporter Mla subunit MlaD